MFQTNRIYKNVQICNPSSGTRAWELTVLNLSSLWYRYIYIYMYVYKNIHIWFIGKNNQNDAYVKFSKVSERKWFCVCDCKQVTLQYSASQQARRKCIFFCWFKKCIFLQMYLSGFVYLVFKKDVSLWNCIENVSFLKIC